MLRVSLYTCSYQAQRIPNGPKTKISKSKAITKWENRTYFIWAEIFQHNFSSKKHFEGKKRKKSISATALIFLVRKAIYSNLFSFHFTKKKMACVMVHCSYTHFFFGDNVLSVFTINYRFVRVRTCAYKNSVETRKRPLRSEIERPKPGCERAHLMIFDNRCKSNYNKKILLLLAFLFG